MSTQRKVVLVTGASSGIGRATAQEFAKLGYHVAVTGRNQARLDEVVLEMVEALRVAGKQEDASAEHFLAIQADFEDEKQVDSVVPKVIEKFNRLDILINNAGFVGQSLDLMDEGFFADFQRILQVNLMASARLAQMAAPHLARERPIEDPGILINVSSIADRLPLKAMAYCVSKAGLSMLTKTLANSLEGRPVRVLTVSPGPIMTSIAPDERVIAAMGKRATLLGRAGLSLEVANLILFLASDKASYMHACCVDIDGGQLSKVGLLVTEGRGKPETGSN